MTEDETQIQVVRERELEPGASTPGIIRHTAFDVPEAIVSQSTIGPGVTSDWHHHATRTLLGYLVSGELRFDYGPRGSLSVEFSAHDYFRIPPRLIHRDVNPRTDREAIVVAVLIGEGPAVVNTTGPADS